MNAQVSDRYVGSSEEEAELTTAEADGTEKEKVRVRSIPNLQNLTS